jgi:coiled-coil domain-containing protein 63/114
VALTKARVVRQLDRVRFYEEAFSKIRMATNIKDIRELVSAFKAAEAANFALFNFIAEQNSEIERLEELSQSLRSDMKRAKRERGVLASHERHKLRPLEERKAGIESAADRYEVRYSEARDMVRYRRSC